MQFHLRPLENCGLFWADFHETDEYLTAIRATTCTEFYPSRTIREQYGQKFFDVPK